VILRPATPEDKDFFYVLRVDPMASRMSRRGPPTKAEHERWWSRTTDHRYVADADGGPVGTIRISDEGMISIIVSPGLRGKGYGKQMLMLAQPIARSLGFERLQADVAWENQASQGAFLRAGWRPILFEVSV